MSDRCSVRLGDFGISKILDSTDNEAQTLDTVRVGTKRYMAPEVLHHKKISFKADIWSVGCVLYELSTLQAPTYDKAGTFWFELIPENFSRKWVEIIRGCLCENCEDRMSAKDLLDTLIAPICKNVLVQRIFSAAAAWQQQLLNDLELSFRKQMLAVQQYLPATPPPLPSSESLESQRLPSAPIAQNRQSSEHSHLPDWSAVDGSNQRNDGEGDFSRLRFVDDVPRWQPNWQDTRPRSADWNERDSGEIQSEVCSDYDVMAHLTQVGNRAAPDSGQLYASQPAPVRLAAVPDAPRFKSCSVGQHNIGELDPSHVSDATLQHRMRHSFAAYDSSHHERHEPSQGPLSQDLPGPDRTQLSVAQRRPDHHEPPSVQAEIGAAPSWVINSDAAGPCVLDSDASRLIRDLVEVREGIRTTLAGVMRGSGSGREAEAAWSLRGGGVRGAGPNDMLPTAGPTAGHGAHGACLEQTKHNTARAADGARQGEPGHPGCAHGGRIPGGPGATATVTAVSSHIAPIALNQSQQDCPVTPEDDIRAAPQAQLVAGWNGARDKSSGGAKEVANPAGPEATARLTGFISRTCLPGQAGPSPACPAVGSPFVGSAPASVSRLTSAEL